ncbi:MAG: hypothetical protein HQL48_07615 [Gammaproteobacteria bacterium]|nr:hypothetical protein [Gammaproteobacteria bacterium]
MRHDLQPLKDLFLKSVEKSDQDQLDLYSLEDEFRKTGQNRDLRLYILVFSFLFGLLLIALISRVLISEEERGVTIEINAFEDLRLKEIIGTMNSREGQVKALREELADLKLEQEHQLQQLQQEQNRQLQQLGLRPLEEEALQRQQQEIAQNSAEATSALEDAFLPRRRAIEAQITDLEAKINANQADLGGQSAAMIQNPELRLAEIKLDQQRKSYESKIAKLRTKHQQQLEELTLRYNPLFEAPSLRELLQQKIRAPSAQPVATSESDAYLQQQEIISPQLISTKNRLGEQQQQLLQRLTEIPFLNDSLRTTFQLETISTNLAQSQAQLQQILTSQLRQQQITIDRVDHLLAHLSREHGYHGYITDPRDPDQIGIYLDRAYHITGGERGLIFRSDDHYLASVEFYRRDGLLSARTTAVAKGEVLQPFDKIVLLLEKGEQ